MARPYSTTRTIIPGELYGRLTIVEEASHLRGQPRRVVCRCVCGTVKILPLYSLRSGNTRSCGCLPRDILRQRCWKHGMDTRAERHEHPEYGTWKNAKTRCFYSRGHAWKNYGGRGITMCEAWRDDFATFFRDMGPRPTPKHTLERIDNDGPYSPENCIWATYAEQAKNRRHSRHLTFRGETLHYIEWAQRFGIPLKRVWGRLRRGWSIEGALTAPRYARRC